MGIQNFYPWLVRHYATCITTTVTDVDVLAIDMNGVIHSVAQRIFQYGDYAPRQSFLVPSPPPAVIEKEDRTQLERVFFVALGDSINDIIQLIRPKDTLILCIDGVAPYAKMMEQRKRRANSEVAVTGFDPCQISPGTDFMRRLTASIQDAVHTQWTEVSHVVLSSEQIAGEGEHKCIRLLKHYSPSFRKVVYGVDADLIMLALGSRLKNVHIYRECSKTYVDIDALSQQISGNVGAFLVTSCLVGNDFLPRCISIDELKDVMDDALTRSLITPSGKIITTELMGVLERHAKDTSVALITHADRTVAIDYVTGLQWVFSYYTQHPNTIDQMWHYPHSVPPLICALRRELELYKPFYMRPRPPLSQKEQLDAILPPRCRRTD